MHRAISLLLTFAMLLVSAGAGVPVPRESIGCCCAALKPDDRQPGCPHEDCDAEGSSCCCQVAQSALFFWQVPVVTRRPMARKSASTTDARKLVRSYRPLLPPPKVEILIVGPDAPLPGSLSLKLPI